MPRGNGRTRGPAWRRLEREGGCPFRRRMRSRQQFDRLRTETRTGSARDARAEATMAANGRVRRAPLAASPRESHTSLQTAAAGLCRRLSSREGLELGDALLRRGLATVDL